MLNSPQKITQSTKKKTHQEKLKICLFPPPKAGVKNGLRDLIGKFLGSSRRKSQGTQEENPKEIGEAIPGNLGMKSGRKSQGTRGRKPRNSGRKSQGIQAGNPGENPRRLEKEILGNSGRKPQGIWAGNPRNSGRNPGNCHLVYSEPTTRAYSAPTPSRSQADTKSFSRVWSC